MLLSDIDKLYINFLLVELPLENHDLQEIELKHEQEHWSYLTPH